jgi:hypothetical protein
MEPSPLAADAKDPRTDMRSCFPVKPLLRDWLPCALLTPLLFRLVTWLPLDRQRWLLAVPVHLVCCIVTLGACDVGAKMIDPAFYAAGTGALGKLGHEFGGRNGPSVQIWKRPAVFGVSQTPTPPPTNLQNDNLPESKFDMIRMVGFYLPIYCAIVGVAHALYFTIARRKVQPVSLSRALRL